MNLYKAHEAIAGIQERIEEFSAHDIKQRTETTSSKMQEEMHQYVDQAVLCIDSLTGAEKIDACCRLGMLLGKPLTFGFHPSVSAKLLKQVIEQGTDPKQNAMAGMCLAELIMGGHFKDKGTEAESLEEEDIHEDQAQETGLCLQALLKAGDSAFQEMNLGNLTASFIFGREYSITGLGSIKDSFDMIKEIRGVHQQILEKERQKSLEMQRQAAAREQEVLQAAAAREQELLQKISSLQSELTKTQSLAPANNAGPQLLPLSQQASAVMTTALVATAPAVVSKEQDTKPKQTPK